MTNPGKTSALDTPIRLLILTILLPFFGNSQVNSKGAIQSKSTGESGKLYGLVVGISEYASLPRLE